MTNIIPYAQLAPTDDTFSAAVRLTLATVAPSSARTYQHTYDRWTAWTAAAGLPTLDLRPAHVLAYLAARPVTLATRQRELTALRALAKVLAMDYTRPEYRALYDALKMIKAPAADAAGTERTRRALNAGDVWSVLNVWKGQQLVALRNRALLAVMFFTGLRRAELAALRWNDIDLETGVIVVRHGKGDKRREVAIVGDDCIRALTAWQTATPGREYVFCAVLKGDKLAADKPMTGRAINKIVDATAAAAGVEFAPHDARRTLATDLLARGMSVADVQAQLGHAHASTTIQGYGMGADARRRRARFETSY